MAQNSDTPIGYSGSPHLGYRRDGAPWDGPRVSLAEIEAMGVAALQPAPEADTAAAFRGGAGGAGGPAPNVSMEVFLQCASLIEPLSEVSASRVSAALAALFARR